MNVTESDIAEYMLENEDVYTCTIAGDKYVIHVQNGGTIVAQGLAGYFMRFSHGNAKFVPQNSVEQLEVDVVFPKELIDAIKAKTLDKAIRENLDRLLPAATAMIQHYTNGAVPAPHIRMYVLKDIDFVQNGKGVVVICPTSDGVTQERDFIKGYIYCSEQDSIKFETVQGWRYRKASPTTIINRRYNMDWLELMSA